MENKEKDLRLNRTSFSFGSKRTDIKPDVSGDVVATSFTLPGELFDRLKYYCVSRRSTKAVVIRRALVEFLDRQEKKD